MADRKGIAEQRMKTLRQRLSDEVTKKVQQQTGHIQKLSSARLEKLSPKKVGSQISRKNETSPKVNRIQRDISTDKNLENLASSSKAEETKDKRRLSLRLSQAREERVSPKKGVLQLSAKNDSSSESNDLLQTSQSESNVPKDDSLQSSGDDYEAMDIDEQAQLLWDIRAMRNLCDDWQSFVKEPEWTPMETDLSVVAAPPQSSVLIVLDTNVLVSHLMFIKELRDVVTLDGVRPVLYLPWMVIQELDHLKDRSDTRTSKAARSAVTFLNDSFKTKHPRVRGQTAREASRARGVHLEERCPDDSILESCLQLKQQGFQVMLLSNDVNLCNKALMNGIDGVNRYELSNKVVRSYEKTSSIMEELLPKQEKQRPLMNRLARASQEEQKPCTNRSGLSAQEEQKSRRQESNADVQPIPTLDMTERLKNTLLEAISKVLSRGMEALYGPIWQKRVLYKPPWEIHTALASLAQHWFALCETNLPSSVKNAVNRLKYIFRKGEKGISEDILQEACTLGLDLCKMMPSNYDDIIIPLENTLKNFSFEPNASVKSDDSGRFPGASIGTSSQNCTSTKASNTTSEQGHPSCALVMAYFQNLWRVVHSFCLELEEKLRSGITLDDVTVLRSKEMVDGIQELLNHINGILSVPEDEINVSYPSIKGLLDLLLSVTPSTETNVLRIQDLLIFCAFPDCRVTLKNGLAQLIECGELLLRAITTGK